MIGGSELVLEEWQCGEIIVIFGLDSDSLEAIPATPFPSSEDGL
jgi:hypothetical protein